jgi:hypothetical protein
VLSRARGNETGRAQVVAAGEACERMRSLGA